MKSIALRIAVTFLTFAIGLGSAAAWVTKSKPPVQVPPTSFAGPTLEMVFVLDTTGSMGGLIDGAKQRIWGIVNEVMQSPAHPDVRIGLVAYRDRGDTYVTQVLPLTNDLDRVYSTLMEYRAEGGGDTPENVRRALADGVHRAGWSRAGSRASQILFLVGDAPPHNDYQDEPDVLKTTAEAINRGLIVNTIQCGSASDTAQIWQSIARRGEGQFFAIAQSGGVETIATPFDSRLSQLGTRLGSTYLAYGGGSGPEGERYRADADAKQSSTEMRVSASAPMAAQAERTYNKVLNKDAYIGDLLQDIENGTTLIESVKAEDLLADLRKLSSADRKKEIERRLDERKKIRAEVVSLAKQRDEFIAAERKKKLGGQTGFDAAVATTLKSQMARKGIK